MRIKQSVLAVTIASSGRADPTGHLINIRLYSNMSYDLGPRDQLLKMITNAEIIRLSNCCSFIIRVELGRGRNEAVMDYLHSIAMEIAELDARALHNSGKALSVRDFDAGAVRLITALKGDLLHTVIGLAINGSVANSLARSTPIDRPQRLFETFSPWDTGVFAYAAERLLENVFNYEVYSRLQHLMHMLALAKRLSAHWMESEEWSLVSDLSASWCETCLAALELNQSLTEILTSSGTWLTSTAETQKINLLSAVVDGNSPCVDHRGHVFVPEWLDRRAKIRRPLRQIAMIIAGDSRHEAQLVDISTGGIGARIQGSLPVGTSAQLILSETRVIAATVTWAVGSRIGLKFITPLSSEDPLLQPPIVKSDSV